MFTLSEVAGFIHRNFSYEYAKQVVDSLIGLPNLRIHYFSGTRDFQDSILSTSLATGLSGADSIHYLQSLSTPAVNEIVTLDHNFSRVASQIKITFLGK